MIGRAMAVTAQQPVQADQRRAADEAGLAIERDRLFRGDLKIEFQMVLQVLADAGQIVDDRNAQRAQFRRRPDAGQVSAIAAS